MILRMEILRRKRILYKYFVDFFFWIMNFEIECKWIGILLRQRKGFSIFLMCEYFVMFDFLEREYRE